MFLSFKLYSQDKTIGLNSTIYYNKFMGGVSFTTWKSGNDRKTYPNWVFKASGGVVGYKTFKPDKTRITITEKGSMADGAQEFPSGIFKPKSLEETYKGTYYNSSEKLVLVGIDLSVIKQFRISNGFYFGMGAGWNTSSNKGKVKWYNPIINDSITEKSLLKDFFTVYLLTNIGYSAQLSKNIIFNTSFQMNFHFPDDTHPDASFPNVGVEQDVSISINYIIN